LVQAVPPVPPNFFHQVVRRRTVPLYQHPALRPVCDINVIIDWLNPNAGSITDGDNHVWLGDKTTLSDGKWRGLIEDEPMFPLRKWKASIVSETSSGLDNDGLEGNVSGSDRENEDNVKCVYSLL
jgi:hypothetical protein